MRLTRFVEFGRKIVCVGKNYGKHAQEMGGKVPDKPLIFLKPEVCVDSIESIVSANNAGAHRIELYSALEIGGLTPTIGLVKQTQELCPKLPICAMIRPRSGDFCYSDNEILIMQKDIQIFKSNGVNGFVFGILRTDGTIDTKNCKLLIGINFYNILDSRQYSHFKYIIILETAAPLECTFHRAIFQSIISSISIQNCLGISTTPHFPPCITRSCCTKSVVKQ
ncbi:unnamed protein product [Oppiella nova]|uniref:Copper homeostasis protein cutC homolog n=1 Tax=Oppiella nova TaxID=334625 RepID=A0A7R9LZR8_9ACAR|nr:unnamed protein product [Oppiella nova]CAG2168492.1 unnamed protein product [Oppiella nova]